MGMPNINIAFRTAASTVVQRSQRGIVGIILKDSASSTGAQVMTDESKIPASLSAVNKDYLNKTWIGYVNKPKKVIAFILPADATDFTTALAYFATQKINYIAGPVDCTSEEALAISAWVIAQRANKRTYKVVLPNTAADSDGIVNFATDGIAAGTVYATPAYCGRIAGMLAGTPITISATYAPLPEVTDVTRLTETEMDAAVDAGKFIIFHDGEKVKVGRAINSFQTTTADKGDVFKKIKIVDAIDMMQDDIRLLTQDNYFGKYPNNYDNKCLLMTAIQEYFAGLENTGTNQVLDTGSTVEFDLDKIRAYLTQQGTDPSEMTDIQLKKENTGTHVFFRGHATVLDTMEDFDLDMSM